MRRGSRSKSESGKATDKTARVEMGSGNVFADLGLPQPELALAKAELVRRIRELIAEKKLTQVEAADLLGVDQPKVSALTRGKVEGYTVDRLFRYLTALGQRVEIKVRPAGRGAARESVLVVVN
jgi:predicted XRE-type DNA-binding protein